MPSFARLSRPALLLGLALLLAWPGSPAFGFGTGGYVNLSSQQVVADAVQSNGKVVLVGSTITAPIRLLVVRLNSSGSVDRSFNHGRPVLGPKSSIGTGIVLQRDGKIVVAGSLTDAHGGFPRGAIVERVTPGGSFDRKFRGRPPAGLRSANAVALASNGKIVLGGSSTAADGFPRSAFARLTSSGAVDTHFASHGLGVVDLGRYSEVSAVGVLGNGSIAFAGSARPDLKSTVLLAGVARSNGRLARAVSSSFGANGFAAGYGLTISDGKIIVGGAASDLGLGAVGLVVRLTGSGTVDHGFGSGGVVRLISAQLRTQCCGEDRLPGVNAVTVSHGAIIAGGTFDSLGAARPAVWALNSRGGVDLGFHGGRYIGPFTAGNREIRGVAAAPGGGVFAVGFTTAPFATTSAFVAKL